MLSLYKTSRVLRYSTPLLALVRVLLDRKTVLVLVLVHVSCKGKASALRHARRPACGIEHTTSNEGQTVLVGLPVYRLKCMFATNNCVEITNSRNFD